MAVALEGLGTMLCYCMMDLRNTVLVPTTKPKASAACGLKALCDLKTVLEVFEYLSGTLFSAR